MDTTKGIWNPRDLNATLSIVSSPGGPYDDRDVEGGLFRYDYRIGSIERDNTKLRRAKELRRAAHASAVAPRYVPRGWSCVRGQVRRLPPATCSMQPTSRRTLTTQAWRSLRTGSSKPASCSFVGVRLSAVSPTIPDHAIETEQANPDSPAGYVDVAPTATSRVGSCVKRRALRSRASRWS